ncbi:regulation of enolase protein 1-like [Acanthaster planci]|uniref:Regulation of enolase protein 1-like n=1 Tax=Acanthaster planci TaxID=133434 RepID=A0A8B7YTM6_ACAPL|nr:regulation of enolase protein 1-like [Acanthaster planci]
MDGGDSEILLSSDFSNPELDLQLAWLNEPKKNPVVKAAPGLLICMDEKTDFWQKTYYEPMHVQDDGHALYMEVSEVKVVMETSFTLKAVNQFDQAGLLVRFDEDHWIKMGIEFVDGTCRLSCVVTNTYSDWSTQDWPLLRLHVRIFRLRNNFVVEGSADGKTWSMMRICHLHVPETASLKMGLMACAPAGGGGQVTFDKLVIKKCSGYHHTN